MKKNLSNAILLTTKRMSIRLHSDKNSFFLRMKIYFLNSSFKQCFNNLLQAYENECFELFFIMLTSK